MAEAYTATMDHIKEIGKEDLGKFLPKVLGYGIGIHLKEDSLARKAENTRKIEPGMVFNLRISLANHDTRQNRNCLLIADTIQVNSQNIEVLTKGIPKAYADISYSIDDNDENNEGKPKEIK